MDVTFVFAVLAGVMMACAVCFHRKWKAAEKRCDMAQQQLDDALGEARQTQQQLDAMANSEGKLAQCVRDNDVLVVSNHPASDYAFLVKSFKYDPFDPADKDFAIRRAEELIEIIQTI